MQNYNHVRGFNNVEQLTQQVKEKLMAEFQLSEEVATKFIKDFNADLIETTEKSAEMFWCVMDPNDIQNEVVAYVREAFLNE